jgi:hypothetical protein
MVPAAPWCGTGFGTVRCSPVVAAISVVDRNVITYLLTILIFIEFFLVDRWIHLTQVGLLSTCTQKALPELKT